MVVDIKTCNNDSTLGLEKFSDDSVDKNKIIQLWDGSCFDIDELVGYIISNNGINKNPYSMAEKMPLWRDQSDLDLILNHGFLDPELKIQFEDLLSTLNRSNLLKKKPQILHFIGECGLQILSDYNEAENYVHSQFALTHISNIIDQLDPELQQEMNNITNFQGTLNIKQLLVNYQQENSDCIHGAGFKLISFYCNTLLKNRDTIDISSLHPGIIHVEDEVYLYGYFPLNQHNRLWIGIYSHLVPSSPDCGGAGRIGYLNMSDSEFSIYINQNSFFTKPGDSQNFGKVIAEKIQTTYRHKLRELVEYYRKRTDLGVISMIEPNIIDKPKPIKIKSQNYHPDIDNPMKFYFYNQIPYNELDTYKFLDFVRIRRDPNEDLNAMMMGIVISAESDGKNTQLLVFFSDKPNNYGISFFPTEHVYKIGDGLAIFYQDVICDHENPGFDMSKFEDIYKRYENELLERVEKEIHEFTNAPFTLGIYSGDINYKPHDMIGDYFIYLPKGFWYPVNPYKIDHYPDQIFYGKISTNNNNIHKTPIPYLPSYESISTDYKRQHQKILPLLYNIYVEDLLTLNQPIVPLDIDESSRIVGEEEVRKVDNVNFKLWDLVKVGIPPNDRLGVITKIGKNNPSGFMPYPIERRGIHALNPEKMRLIKRGLVPNNLELAKRIQESGAYSMDQDIDQYLETFYQQYIQDITRGDLILYENQIGIVLSDNPPLGHFSLTSNSAVYTNKYDPTQAIFLQRVGRLSLRLDDSNKLEILNRLYTSYINSLLSDIKYPSTDTEISIGCFCQNKITGEDCIVIKIYSTDTGDQMVGYWTSADDSYHSLTYLAFMSKFKLSASGLYIEPIPDGQESDELNLNKYITLYSKYKKGIELISDQSIIADPEDLENINNLRISDFVEVTTTRQNGIILRKNLSNNELDLFLWNHELDKFVIETYHSSIVKFIKRGLVIRDNRWFQDELRNQISNESILGYRWLNYLINLFERYSENINIGDLVMCGGIPSLIIDIYSDTQRAEVIYRIVEDEKINYDTQIVNLSELSLLIKSQDFKSPNDFEDISEPQIYDIYEKFYIFYLEKLNIKPQTGKEHFEEYITIYDDTNLEQRIKDLEVFYFTGPVEKPLNERLEELEKEIWGGIQNGSDEYRIINLEKYTYGDNEENNYYYYPFSFVKLDDGEFGIVVSDPIKINNTKTIINIRTEGLWGVVQSFDIEDVKLIAKGLQSFEDNDYSPETNDIDNIKYLSLIQLYKDFILLNEQQKPKKKKNRNRTKKKKTENKQARADVLDKFLQLQNDIEQALFDAQDIPNINDHDLISKRHADQVNLVIKKLSNPELLIQNKYNLVNFNIMFDEYLKSYQDFKQTYLTNRCKTMIDNVYKKRNNLKRLSKKPCMARTWADGCGIPCFRETEAGKDFCLQHRQPKLGKITKKRPLLDVKKNKLKWKNDAMNHEIEVAGGILKPVFEYIEDINKNELFRSLIFMFEDQLIKPSSRLRNKTKITLLLEDIDQLIHFSTTALERIRESETSVAKNKAVLLKIKTQFEDEFKQLIGIYNILSILADFPDNITEEEYIKKKEFFVQQQLGQNDHKEIDWNPQIPQKLLIPKLTPQNRTAKKKPPKDHELLSPRQSPQNRTAKKKPPKDHELLSPRQSPRNRTAKKKLAIPQKKSFKKPEPDLESPGVIETPRKVIKIFQATADHNQTFQKGEPELYNIFEELSRESGMFEFNRSDDIHKISNLNDIKKELDELTKNNKQIVHLIIRAHGNRQGTGLVLSNNYTLDISNGLKTFATLLKPNLSTKASILLHSCNVGKGGPNGKNFASVLAKELRNILVFATENEIYEGTLLVESLIIDDIQENLDIDYRIDPQAKHPNEMYRFGDVNKPKKGGRKIKNYRIFRV